MTLQYDAEIGQMKEMVLKACMIEDDGGGLSEARISTRPSTLISMSEGPMECAGCLDAHLLAWETIADP